MSDIEEIEEIEEFEETERKLVFDCSYYIHCVLVYELMELLERFSLQSGCYIFPDFVTQSSFLEDCLINSDSLN